MTLALLEDSSWYVANYTMATEMPFGRGAGCQFARSGCTRDEEGSVQLSPQSDGFHCSDIGDMGCDIAHTFKARCGLLHPVDMASPRDLLAGFSAPDEACPMFIREATDCRDDGQSSHPGEVFGESSKCFQMMGGEPICLHGTCNEETQGIDVRYESEAFSCTRDGQILNTAKGMSIKCPRIAAVCPKLVCPSNCSGRGVCDEDREGRHSCICDDPFDDTQGCWGQ